VKLKNNNKTIQNKINSNKKNEDHIRYKNKMIEHLLILAGQHKSQGDERREKK
jgi:hypothetical protein